MPTVNLLWTQIPFACSKIHQIFAIGDVHGCADLFAKALEAIARTPTARGRVKVLVLTGDLIDRGPDSLGCIDLAMRAQELTGAVEVIALKGNHEQMLDFGLEHIGFDETKLNLDTMPAENSEALGAWLVNGGHKLLGDAPVTELPGLLGKDRRLWLANMKKAYFSEQIAFVHAGLPPHHGLYETLDIPAHTPIRTLDESRHWAWIREPFLSHQPSSKGHHGYFVCHGHTIPHHDPLNTTEQIAHARINVDGGSFRTGKIRFAEFCGNTLRVNEVQ